jgi:putative nucleotidyltransferase with HDIG domain
MKIAYRASQFFQALFAKLTPEDIQLVNQHLSPALLEVFHHMNRSDQLHGIRVLRSVCVNGENHAVLCAAALLHDVGKSRHPFRLWDRILVVLGTALIPNAVERWGNGEPRGWRRAFVVAAQHPHWGAEIIRAAGGSEELAALVKRHQEGPLPHPETEIDRLLLRLQEADGVN